MIEADAPVLVQGRVNVDERGAKIIADEVIHLDEAQKAILASVTIRVEAPRVSLAEIPELKEILLAHPGRCPVSLSIVYPQKGQVELELPEEFSVEPSPELTRSIERLLGYPALEIQLLSPESSNQRRPAWGRS